ncbi:MAG: PAS domain S-box-containing protein [Sulfurimonas sp.]|jgi:PAS domain S-box-containing protein|uniref:MASE3 domain-containing protein n=1 Tax=Sulfurimonas sp. TaxID=2022749 RepID=UPI0039E54F35
MQEVSNYKLYTTSLIPFIFILTILLARYYGGHVLFHSLAEMFSILFGFMMIVIVFHTYQFTKNNFILYLGLGYFWVSMLDVMHMLTYPEVSIIEIENPNIMLTFWIAARFLEAFILFSAIFVNFHTISKVKVFILFGLGTAIVNILAFSKYLPILYEQENGLTSLKINLEYSIIFILILALFTYTKKRKNFDKSIYYYIIASIILTIFTEFTLTFYAKVDDSFTMLAHLFKFLSYWMIFLSIIKISLEKPFTFLAHESSTYNSIPFSSILVDSEGIIRQINDSTKTFLNLEADKIINQNNHMLFHNQNTEESECDVCKVIKRGKRLISHSLEKETTSTYSFTVNPISMKDMTLGSVQVCIDISQQLQLEQDKAETQERLKLIVESSTDGIWDWNLLTNQVYYSPRWKELLGYMDNELENRPETWKNLIHPDDKEQVYIDVMSSQEGKSKFYKNIHRLKHKDKHWVWIETRGQTIFDESGKAIRMMGSHTDITEKKYAIELLKQKKEELETIIQEAPNPIMLHNEDGTVLMVNKSWEMLTGYKHKDIDTIEKWTYLAYGERMPVVKEYIDNLYALKKKVDEGEYPIHTKNGDTITWQFSSAPLGLIDGKRTVISSAMDITELKHKDEMLIDQSRHAAMGEMIGMIAHQWRQPISAIAMDANNMLLDISLNDFNVDNAKEYSNSILNQTQDLSKTIDDFRNFFKPDKVISEVDIKETIDTTLSIVKDSLKNNNIELTRSFETDKKVKAYPRELMQVFVNIITNSKDVLTSYKKEDARISIRVYEDEKYINTEICDNGGGIDANILPKVFDPYFSTKDEKTGTGIGLYMSKMIIQEHLNGIIDVYNNDEGACFTIKLLKEQ